MEFKPRKVELHQCTNWVRQGYALVRRRPISFLAVGVVYVLAVISTEIISIMAFLLVPPIICVGCWVAQAADESCSIAHILERTTTASFWRIIVLGIVIIALFLICSLALLTVSYAVVTLLNAGADSPRSSDEISQMMLMTEPVKSSASSIAGALAVFPMALWIFLSAFIIWFICPLLANAGIGYRACAQQCWNAITLNTFMFGVWFCVAITLIPIYYLFALIVPWVAIICATMYVSYCDIWLHRGIKMPIVHTKLVEGPDRATMQA